MKAETDNLGFLKKYTDWNPKVAEYIAFKEEIKLAEEHWEIIKLVRKFYQLYQLAPSQRPLVNYIAKNLGKEKGNSIYLMKLFSGKPAITIAKISGLPRPDNCF